MRAMELSLNTYPEAEIHVTVKTAHLTLSLREIDCDSGSGTRWVLSVHAHDEFAFVHSHNTKQDDTAVLGVNATDFAEALHLLSDAMHAHSAAYASLRKTKQSLP